MMKKFQIKGLRNPLQRKSKGGASDTDESSRAGCDISARADRGIEPESRHQNTDDELNHEQDDEPRPGAEPVVPSTSNVEVLEVVLPKKREKVGLLKSIRKRISTTMSRKKDHSVDSQDEAECCYSAHSSSCRDSDKLDRRSRCGKHKTNGSFKVCRPIQRPVRSSHSEECLDVSSDGDQAEQVWHHVPEKYRTDMKNISFGKDLHSLRSDYIKSREGAQQISRSNSPSSSQRVDRRTPPTAPRPPLCSSKASKDNNKSKTANQSPDPVFSVSPEQGRMWSLTAEIFRLSKYGWYWGPITRVEAEEKLVDQSYGAFLVRDSSDERYLLSLSFRSYGRTLHTRIEHCNGMFSFYAQPESEGYTSIVDLIEHSMAASETGVFSYSSGRMPGSPSFPVRLTKPVSRFTQVRSLQYLCRFVIRQYTRFDHIQKLPLPTRIIGWLSENQY